MPSTLVTDILDAFAELDGGIHHGFRPVHAKGFMYSGTFTPSPEAVKLTRAPHAHRPSTPITVRFSGTTGVPTGSDTDPMARARKGLRSGFTWPTTSTPISLAIRSTPSRPGREKSSSNSCVPSSRVDRTREDRGGSGAAADRGIP